MKTCEFPSTLVLTFESTRQFLEEFQSGVGLPKQVNDAGRDQGS